MANSSEFIIQSFKKVLCSYCNWLKSEIYFGINPLFFHHIQFLKIIYSPWGNLCQDTNVSQIIGYYFDDYLIYFNFIEYIKANCFYCSLRFHQMKIISFVFMMAGDALSFLFNYKLLNFYVYNNYYKLTCQYYPLPFIKQEMISNQLIKTNYSKYEICYTNRFKKSYQFIAQQT